MDSDIPSRINGRIQKLIHKPVSYTHLDVYKRQASYKVGDRVYLEGKPFEITRVDDWNVELMDRSIQNPQPRLERKDSFMRLVRCV